MGKLKLSVVSLIVATAAIAGADQSIYSSKLDNGWQIWGWATKIEPKGDTLNVNAGQDWQAIYFHHEAQPGSGFTSLTFKVNGGAKGGQKLQVRAVFNKNPMKETLLKPLAAGKWTTITIPLKTLGVTAKFDGIWIQAQKACSFQLRGVALKK